MNKGPNKCFRMLFPKSSSNLSPCLLSLLSDFDSSLTERMTKLIPQNKHEILTLTWMNLAMESLCETHSDINILMDELHLHDKRGLEHRVWVNVYEDITARLLDFCHTFTSELSLINHCISGIKLLRPNQESKQCIEICSKLDYWRQNCTVKNPQCGIILGGLVESLHIPKVKNFTEGKEFMKAFYAANVLTTYIWSVFVTLLSNSDKDLLHISVSKQTLWSKAFLDLQNVVNAEIRDALSSDGTMVLKELECVDTKVKKMSRIVEDDLVQESFKDSIMELKEKVEKLGHGLNKLSWEINNILGITLKVGRKTMGMRLRERS